MSNDNNSTKEWRPPGYGWTRRGGLWYSDPTNASGWYFLPLEEQPGPEGLRAKLGDPRLKPKGRDGPEM